MNSESSPSGQAANVVTVQASQNLFNRLIGVWFSPGETFAEIGRVPRALVPTLLLIIIAGASNYLLVERYGYENIVKATIEEMVNAGYIPQDKAEEAIQKSLTPGGVTGGRIQSAALPAISIIAAMLLLIAFFKILAAAIGAQCPFRQIYSVTVHAFLAVNLVYTAVLLLVIYLKDPVDLDVYNPVASSLGALAPLIMNGLPKFAIRLLSYADVFIIWRLIVLAIGYSVVMRKMKAWTAAGFLALLHIIAAVIIVTVASQFG